MMLDLKEKIGYLKKFKCGIFTTVWCYFLKILVKRVKHFLGEQLLECSGSGPVRTAPAILRIQRFHFRVMYYTPRKRGLRTYSNVFESTDTNGGPLLLRNSWSDREALLWQGTSLYQIENGLELITIGIHYTYYIFLESCECVEFWYLFMQIK